MRRKIDLSAKAEDLSSWNRFTLDLSTLFEAERGPCIRSELVFCQNTPTIPVIRSLKCKTIPRTKNHGASTRMTTFTNGVISGTTATPTGIPGRERHNPYHVSYYNSNRFVSTSLLATDIGLIAKIGGDNTMKVIATNMTNAQPIQATIKVLDYQLQEMSSSMTDAQGFATIKPERRPFLIIAESQGRNSPEAGRQ